MSNTDRWYEPLARGAADGVDKRAAVLEALDQIERTSLDFYATIRSLYRQRRIDEINNGVQPEGRPGRSIISEKAAPGVAKNVAAPVDDVSNKPQL
jgi:phospholipid-binding lipoprotein MlaA